jgi:hypothetical protein
VSVARKDGVVSRAKSVCRPKVHMGYRENASTMYFPKKVEGNAAETRCSAATAPRITNPACHPCGCTKTAFVQTAKLLSMRGRIVYIRVPRVINEYIHVSYQEKYRIPKLRPQSNGKLSGY